MSDQYIGEIRIFPFGYAPEGWLFCNGIELQIRQYQGLYAVLNNQYGGVAPNTFALPHLGGLVVAGSVNNENNDRYGVNTVALVNANIPAHGHMALAATTIASSSSPNGNMPAKLNGRGNMAFNVGVDMQLEANSVSMVGGVGGGVEAHNNMQPYLGLAFYIATDGIFPSPQPQPQPE